MLTADQLDVLAYEIVDPAEQFQVEIIKDISRRLARMNFNRNPIDWQSEKYKEGQKVFEKVLLAVSAFSGVLSLTLRNIFRRAGVLALRFDDRIYRAAGLYPLPLDQSPILSQVMASGSNKTQGILHNLTLTTAIDAQNIFIQAADRAFLEIKSGLVDYNTAIKNAVDSELNPGK